MINVVKSIIVKDNKFLLLKRSSKSKFFPDLWDFPGGKLDSEEDAAGGVKRETFEETGLDIEPDKLKGEFDHIENDMPIHFRVFSAKNFSGNMKLSQDHTEFKWLSEKELNDYEITPVVKMYFEF